MIEKEEFIKGEKRKLVDEDLWKSFEKGKRGITLRRGGGTSAEIV